VMLDRSLFFDLRETQCMDQTTQRSKPPEKLPLDWASITIMSIFRLIVLQAHHFMVYMLRSQYATTILRTHCVMQRVLEVYIIAAEIGTINVTLRSNYCKYAIIRTIR